MLRAQEADNIPSAQARASGCVINMLLTFKARWTRLIPLLMFCMLQCWVGLSSSSYYVDFNTVFLTTVCFLRLVVGDTDKHQLTIYLAF
jgi:hypothetical protein